MSSRSFARLALGLTLAHAAILASLHLLEPSQALASGLFTDYLRTPSAWVARLGFVVFALLWGATALALRGVLPAGALSKAVTALLLLASGSLVYAATLTATAADPRLAEGPTVLRGLIGIFRLGLFASLVLASFGLRRAPGWRGRARALLVISVATFALLLASLVVLLERDLAGLGQRGVFLLSYVWVVVATLGVLGESGDARPEE